MLKGSQNASLVAIYAGDHRLIIPTTGEVISRVLLVDYYKDHYITAKRVFTDKTASAPTVTNPPNTITSPSKPSDSSVETSADELVNFADSLIGKAKFGYGYNENTLTFTGAGFTYYVYKNQGIDLKSKLANQQSKIGSAVLKSNLQKGDLLLFSLDNKKTSIKRTGIYIGGNQFISLSTSGKVMKQSCPLNGQRITIWKQDAFIKIISRSTQQHDVWCFFSLLFSVLMTSKIDHPTTRHRSFDQN